MTQAGSATLQQIKAIDLWNLPVNEPILKNADQDAATSQQLKELKLLINQQQQQAKKNLNDDLTRIANHYDQIWKLHDEIASQAGYSIVNGLYECPNLKQYLSVCHKLEIGREGSAILTELEGIERSLKNNELKKAVQRISSLESRINNTRVLRGFKNYVAEQIDNLIDTCERMIIKTFRNHTNAHSSVQTGGANNEFSPGPLTFNLCIDLLTSSCTLSRLKGKPVDHELIASAAHDLWFTLDKWKLPTPPDYKWLEAECYTTASALYYNLESLAEDGSLSAAGAEAVPGAAGAEMITRAAGAEAASSPSATSLRREAGEDLISAGLEELFLRYLSYRSSEDIIFRASDFLTNILGIASSPKLTSLWRSMSTRAMQDAWAAVVPESELFERALRDQEKILTQLAAKADLKDLCPVNGVDVQVKIVAAVALAIQILKRAQLIMDEASLRSYLDLTLNRALIKTVLEDLKYQWNAMEDPWQHQNLNNSFCIFNSVCHLYRSLLSENQLPNTKMMESISLTKNRIITLFLEELAVDNDLKTLAKISHREKDLPELFTRARSAVAPEDMQEILAQIPNF